MLKNKDLLLILIRLFLGYIFLSAGICKLTGGNFGQLIGPPWLEASLAKYGLGLFAKVVAISQVLCGMLLLSQRFSLLGAIMLVPMNVAILAVTVSQNWAGTPYVNTVFLLLNLVLLGMEHHKFHFLWQPNQSWHIAPATSDYIGQNMYSWLGIGLSLLTMAVASFNLLLTNIFALLAMASFALTIVRSGPVQKLDLVLLLLPFAAMMILTLGKVIPNAMWYIGGIILIEALLLPLRLYLGRNKSQETATVEAALG